MSTCHPMFGEGLTFRVVNRTVLCARRNKASRSTRSQTVMETVHGSPRLGAGPVRTHPRRETIGFVRCSEARLALFKSSNCRVSCS